MPLPSLQNPPSQKEVLFPAHMIGLCVTQMWKLGYSQASERLLLTVMDTIQKQCLVSLLSLMTLGDETFLVMIY